MKWTPAIMPPPVGQEVLIWASVKSDYRGVIHGTLEAPVIYIGKYDGFHPGSSIWRLTNSHKALGRVYFWAEFKAPPPVVDMEGYVDVKS